jgi:hypothetical protein
MSYYGRPVIKEPVWKPEVPWYFFTGGVGGASAAFALVAEAGGRVSLARRARLVSLGALGASPALLISDLGRPERFLNMLRVFKPTSPMNMGSWLLVATGTAAGLASTHDVLGRFPRTGRASASAAGLLGLPLSTYTAALLANTSVPLWHEARRELPFVFAGSAAASAGAAAAIVAPSKQAGPGRRLAVIGTLLAPLPCGRWTAGSASSAVPIAKAKLGACAGARLLHRQPARRCSHCRGAVQPGSPAAPRCLPAPCSNDTRYSRLDFNRRATRPTRSSHSDLGTWGDALAALMTLGARAKRAICSGLHEPRNRRDHSAQRRAPE